MAKYIDFNNEKRIAFLEFGFLSQFDKVMNNDITLFENNIIELKKLFGVCQIDIFILTHKNDPSRIDKVKEILKKYDMKLQLISYWEDLTQYHENDKEKMINYKNIFDPFVNATTNPRFLGYDKMKLSINRKSFFNAGNLWYRRYIIFKLYDDYIKKNSINYDLIGITRVFSTKIINLQPLHNINSNTLYFSPDTFFLGSHSNIEKLLLFGKNGLFNADINEENKLVMREDIDFVKYCHEFDSNIGSHSFCSEIQILYYIYKNFDNYKNLRLDFTKYLGNEVIKDFYYSDNYPSKINLDFAIKKNDPYLFVKLYR